MRRKTTTSEYITKAIKVHGTTYDYTNTIYTDARTKLDIFCPTCKKTFSQKPPTHLDNHGCPTCGITKRTKTNDQFITDAVAVHGKDFSYDLVEYKGTRTEVKIKCNKCNDVFEQRPDSHLGGNGCNECGKLKSIYEIYKNQKTTLYFIEVDGVYKIGITKTNINHRYRKELKDGIKINVLREWTFDDGLEAYHTEQNIIKAYKEYKCNHSNLYSGKTELFSVDIFSL